MTSCPQYPDPLPLALLVGPGASGRLVSALEGQAYGFQLGPEQPHMEWEGVTRRITAKELATIFRRLYKHCQKCIKIICGYVQKS
jgi:hypothetical protein